MSYRSNAIIRRGINRLNELIVLESGNHAAFTAVSGAVSQTMENVNSAWDAYRDISVKGDKERDERETALEVLIGWIRSWRPVVLLMIPGASDNLRVLPSSGATPDDVIRVAQNIVSFINNNESASEFRDLALESLGTKLESAIKETADATAVLPQEKIALEAYSQSCSEANVVLMRGVDIVRAIYGNTAPEYRQFMLHSLSDEEEDEDEAEAETASV